MIRTPNNTLALPAGQTGRSLAKLARPQNILYSGVLTLLVCRAVNASAGTCIACYLLLWCLYAVAASLNNLVDKAVDIANQRTDNPLISDKLSTRTVLVFCLLNILAVILLQFRLEQPATMFLTAAFLGLSILYSFPAGGLQKLGYAGTLTLANCYGAIPATLGFMQGPFVNGWWILAAFQLLLLVPLLLAKDYKDVAGDTIYGKLTPLVRYGQKPVVAVAAICLALVGIFLATSHLPDLTLWLCFGAYVSGAIVMHATKGNIPPLLYRLIQLAMLGLTWRLLIVPVS